MPSFDSYTCDSCGDEFKAVADANATDGPYCSPSCESDGKGLA